MAETSRYISFIIAAVWPVHGYLAAQKPTFAAVTTKVGFEPDGLWVNLVWTVM